MRTLQILRWQIHVQLQLQSISVSNRSKWNFHVKSVEFAHHVVQQLCHERVFLRLGYMFMSIYPLVACSQTTKQNTNTLSKSNRPWAVYEITSSAYAFSFGHTRAKKPTASWGSPWAPLSCSVPGPRWTLLVMYLKSHTSCRTPPEQTAKTITSSLHLLQIITFVTNVIIRLIFTFVPNWRCFELSSENSVHVFRLFLLLKLMTVGG